MEKWMHIIMGALTGFTGIWLMVIAVGGEVKTVENVYYLLFSWMMIWQSNKWLPWR